jgi:hypothetical protein
MSGHVPRRWRASCWPAGVAVETTIGVSGAAGAAQAVFHGFDLAHRDCTCTQIERRN